MSYEEYLHWVAYAKKRGGFNLGMRVESAAALIAQQVNNGFGGKSKIADFMPHKDDDAATLADVFGMLKVKAKAGKKKV